MNHALIIVLYVLYGLAIVSVPASVGKPRKPLTPAQGVASIVIYTALMIWLAFQW